MNPRFLSICIALFFSLISSAQKQVHSASRTFAAPQIDGRLDDSCWTVNAVSNFTQQSPNPGSKSRQRSEIRFLYDDEAVYIGAWLFDSSPDSILRQYSARDEQDYNADYFSVWFDTYYDQRNAFFYTVSAAGVQADGRYDFDKQDLTWNSVWFSKVSTDSRGWYVEMKIPYSALRFPKKEIQSWGVNFARSIRRYRELSHWNPVNPALQGIINQSGIVNGVQKILSPLRLSLMPYVSGYVENYNHRNAYSFNGGMDVKYGINESFTLDMTLIPDFGQTQSDNLVLNLSPFEVKFDERRYFFTEGTELFSKNDLFYSRRIGAMPSGYGSVKSKLETAEVIESNPSVTKLYNATKVSGRTKKKLGIGFFNAVTAPMHAVLRDTITGQTREVETEALTNYNVLVAEQALRNNSFISIENTSVLRNGTGRDANVLGSQFKLASKRNTYVFEGSGNWSMIMNSGADPVSGYIHNLRAARTKGKYLCEIRWRSVSDKFNPNDLGYLERNNSIGYSFDQSYNIFKPFWRINRWTNDVGIDYFQLFTPRHFTFFNIDGRHIVTFKSFHTYGITWLMQPVTNYDFFETRVPGRYYLYPRNFEGGIFISSDYRRTFAIDVTSAYRWFAERNRTIKRLVVSPRWRVNDRMMVIVRNENEWKKDNVGFADLRGDTIVFGLRDVRTITNTATLKYIFSSTMSLSFRARHYWSAAEYEMYFMLNDDGTLSGMGYNGNKNVNYNAFNIDMVYTWQFLPGSELSVVWKNSIYTSDQFVQPGYFEDVEYTFNALQSNSFSVKLIWFIDYWHVVKRKG